MTVYDFLTSRLHLWPYDMNGDKPVRPSKGSVSRWLDNKAIRLNGNHPKPNDEMPYPVEELIFFPKSKKRTTMMVYETSVDKFEDLLGETAIYRRMDEIRQWNIDNLAVSEMGVV